MTDGFIVLKMLCIMSRYFFSYVTIMAFLPKLSVNFVQYFSQLTIYFYHKMMYNSLSFCKKEKNYVESNYGRQ